MKAPQTGAKPTDPLDRRVAWVAQRAGDAETGPVILSGECRVAVVAPHIPVRAGSVAERADPAPLLDLLAQDLLTEFSHERLHPT